MKYLETYNQNCIGCNTCMTVCSRTFFKEDDNNKSCIVVLDQGGGEFSLSVCNQCGRCVEACLDQALSINKLGIIILDKKKCTSCFLCVGACPTGNMRKIAEDQPPIKCIACGACARECPADALAIISK